MPPSLRQGMDQDVYNLVKILEEKSNDGKPFRSISHAYDAIKRSNSSLSRRKKQVLEDSIDRALRVRKQELEDSSDSEAALEEADEQISRLEDERFQLNRQMTKHWNTHSSSHASKKRRIQAEDGDQKPSQSAAENEETSASSRPNGTLNEEGASEMPHKTPSQKKASRPTRYKVEHISEPIRLGGLDQIQDELLFQLGSMLQDSYFWGPTGWEQIPGILISGPTGVGKTSLVRSIAAQLEVPIVSAAECFDNQERMEKSFTEAVDEAMRLAPCIMLIDDLDHYASNPGSAKHGDSHQQTVKLFQRQVERMRRESPSDRPVVLMATTSKITDLHSELAKGGWFEQTYSIKVPDATARREIFKAVLPNPDTLQEIDIEKLVKCTNGYVGTDIKVLIRGAANRAATRIRRAAVRSIEASAHSDGDVAMAGSEGNRPQLTMKDFLLTIAEFTPSLRKEGFTAIPNVSWDQVGALTQARKHLTTSIIGPIKDPERYVNWGINKPSGVILWGPPGCGKTLVAQAVANEAQASFILINGPELLNKYVGESERGVRELFERARLSAPCILFFDEIDSLVGRRQGSSSESGVRVVNALLTELDGARGRKGVYVIGATNRLDMIDEAMLRPGRLNKHIYVGLPDADERVDILETIVRSSRPDTTKAELDYLEKVARDDRASKFSGADLYALFVEAAEHGLSRASVDNVQRFTEDDWEHALKNTKPSVKTPVK